MSCQILILVKIALLDKIVLLVQMLQLVMALKFKTIFQFMKGLKLKMMFLGPSMVFTNVVNPRSFIVRREEFKKTVLKKGCSVGANATVVCGITIGEYALIGAGSVVTKDVDPFELIYGVPAKHQGWVSKTGNRLSFDDNNIATDSFDNTKYKLENNRVFII